MSSDTDPVHGSNFLRHIVERDLADGTYATRRFAGTPGDAAHHASAPRDAARIRTRFPPEPNGYLHIGHAKSICLNFGLAEDYGGICHLRFDDTNPEKEEQEYVDAIVDAVRWLGFDWHAPEPARPGEATTSHLYFASDYFDFMYRAAEALVEAGKAYVDEQSADEMRALRGDFAAPGRNSPYRDRHPVENLVRLREMKAGLLADGAAVLRAKIDMASPNINLRDPALYRIKRATHHNTGDAWCIYPMYTYAHPIEDALENITHSICTLEFEDQRPFYAWLLDTLCRLGLLAQPRPHQYEFARLNVTYVITSKRKLKALVDENVVAGWDDPRIWIERDDFAEQPPKGFFRLFPGNRVRLKYGYVVECTGADKDTSGRVTAVLARVVADTKSGTPGADAVKVKGTITWVGSDALGAEIRLYDRLFTDAHPDAGGKDFKACLNLQSKRVVDGFVEASVAALPAGERVQFERHGYFVADRHDHATGRAVFNRIAALKDN